jgi:hypothetical protein
LDQNNWPGCLDRREDADFEMEAVPSHLQDVNGELKLKLSLTTPSTMII